MEVIEYQLEIKNKQVLSMPAKAKMLGIQTVQHKPILLVLANAKADNVNRIVRMYDTGEQIDAGGKYIGTHQQREGLFLFHIFDEGEEV